mmetsp:Transcript_32201/g.113368  ORF Transcript_32201/g.113368 Transcript_32201/m.113368 type:complete len:264 (-) Transcript_32201:453-1244(-)
MRGFELWTLSRLESWRTCSWARWPHELDKRRPWPASGVRFPIYETAIECKDGGRFFSQRHGPVLCALDDGIVVGERFFHARLEVRTQLRVPNVLGPQRLWVRFPPAARGHEAKGAVVNRRPLVHPPVEQRADLVHPALALRAFDPGFLVHLVVLLLRQLLFVKRAVCEFQRVLVPELRVALLAPVVLVAAAGVVVRIPADPLPVAGAVAVVDRGFEEELLAAAQHAHVPRRLAVFFVVGDAGQHALVQRIELAPHVARHLGHV